MKLGGAKTDILKQMEAAGELVEDRPTSAAAVAQTTTTGAPVASTEWYDNSCCVCVCVPPADLLVRCDSYIDSCG
jgi:hypothetical protein